MQLEFGKLSANELKDLFLAVKAEKERRSKKNPSNHDAPSWTIPNRVIRGSVKEADVAA